MKHLIYLLLPFLLCCSKDSDPVPQPTIPPTTTIETPSTLPPPSTTVPPPPGGFICCSNLGGCFMSYEEILDYTDLYNPNTCVLINNTELLKAGYEPCIKCTDPRVPTSTTTTTTIEPIPTTTTVPPTTTTGWSTTTSPGSSN